MNAAESAPNEHEHSPVTPDTTSGALVLGVSAPELGPPAFDGSGSAGQLDTAEEGSENVFVDAPSYARKLGTLVIYSAKWVPVARYVELLVADLRASGGVVELVDVDEARDEAEDQRIAVLPSFVWWGPDGRVLRSGAMSPDDVAGLCGVVLKTRR